MTLQARDPLAPSCSAGRVRRRRKRLRAPRVSGPVVPAASGRRLRRGETMSTVERRSAARANQRAAAFIRFQMLGDHEAMHYLLLDVAESERSRLEFTTALASIAGSLAATALGRDQALLYLRSVAESSAVLSGADDIDRYFD